MFRRGCSSRTGIVLADVHGHNLERHRYIRAYGLRFKIEHTFKQAVRLIGTFSCHFWMKAMTSLRRGSGNQYLHRKSAEHRDAVKRKMNAYHLFI